MKVGSFCLFGVMACITGNRSLQPLCSVACRSSGGSDQHFLYMTVENLFAGRPELQTGDSQTLLWTEGSQLLVQCCLPSKGQTVPLHEARSPATACCYIREDVPEPASVASAAW